MNETILTAIIGGVCTLGAAALTAALVYRRAVKVDLAKNKEDAKTELIDKWREYSKDLESRVEKQDEQIDVLRTANRTLEDEIAQLRRALELQASQMAEMERRLGNLEGDERTGE